MKQALLLLPLLAFAADTWQPFAVDEHVSVQFPTTPQELKNVSLPAGSHAYMSMNNAELYQVIGPTPVPAELDVQNPKARQDFYDGVVSGMVGQGAGNTILLRRGFATPAGDGIALTAKVSATKEHKEFTLFCRSFLVQHNSYTLLFLRPDGDTISTAAQRRRFFDSITVKP